MNAQNHLANTAYVTAYQADVRNDLRNARTSAGRTESLRSQLRRGLERSKEWFGLTPRLEADTRQVRNFDLSRASGACEVRQGLRLDT